MMNSTLGVLICLVLAVFSQTNLFATFCCSKMNAKVQQVFWDLVAKGRIPPPPKSPKANGTTAPMSMLQPPNANEAMMPNRYYKKSLNSDSTSLYF